MIGIRVVAQQYIDNGWSVVPLNPGEKRASVRWQSTTYKPSDFNDDSNIAVKLGDPSGGLVDVDCDDSWAVKLAAVLLPITRTFGRTNKPTSHYLYSCPAIKTTQFTAPKDADGQSRMLIEIRSTNGYTMFPPSLHPSGEPVTWDDETRSALPMGAEGLYHYTCDVAIGSLILANWFALDHFAMGDFAGFLAHAKVSDARILDLFRAIGKVAPGDHADEILKFAQHTIDKRRNGEPMRGGPKLLGALGEDVLAKFRGWLKVADVDALDAMNAKHFFVRLGKDSVVGREDDPDEIVFQTPAALVHEYRNQLVQTGTDKDGNPKFAKLFDTWMDSPSRRSYSRVVFAPPPLEASDSEFNLWRGYSVTPAPSHAVLPFLEHVRHVICSDDPEWYEYLMNLMALTIQQPGVPTGVAVVMRGLMGAGKGVVLEWLGALVAQHYRHLTKSEQVVGRFNKAIAGKVIVFLDEAFWAGDKREIGALKSLITEKFLEVEPKNIDSFPVRNVAHVFIATNNEWSVPAGLDERRFFALKVADTYAKAICAPDVRKRYFDRLWDALGHGGAEALLHLLMSRDVRAFDRFDVPTTPELRAQQLQSVRGVMKWLYDCAYSDSIIGGKWPVQAVSNDELFVSYSMWCDTYHEHKLSKILFGRAVTKYLRGKVAQPNAQGVRAGKLRSAAELRTLLPSLDATDMEKIEYLWSSGEWSEALNASNSDDQ